MRRWWWRGRCSRGSIEDHVRGGGEGGGEVGAARGGVGDRRGGDGVAVASSNASSQPITL